MAKSPIDLAALKPLELFALAQLTKPKQVKKVRDRLDVGNGHPVDFVLRVQGGINVGDKTSSTKVEKPTIECVLAHVLDAVNPATRKKIRDALARGFVKYAKGGDQPEASEDAQEDAQDLLQLVCRKQTKPKHGNVTGAIHARVIERAGVPIKPAKAA